MSRKVDEWVGKTDDAKIPKSVLIRIFRDADGICHISGRKIAPGEKWEAEHVIPLWAGGRHRESNLRPALSAPHKEKTQREAGQRAKADRAAASALGLRKEPTMKGRGFAPGRQKRTQKPSLLPLRIYGE